MASTTVTPDSPPALVSTTAHVNPASVAVVKPTISSSNENLNFPAHLEVDKKPPALLESVKVDEKAGVATATESPPRDPLSLVETKPTCKQTIHC